ncbi:MAG: DNA replication protein [Magnetovibrio sp.]|nr:DNA replication protein [Magnetovibrio sp.]
MAQIPFDFDHRPALGGEDFLVADSNIEAVQWIELWPDWPRPVLVIVGLEGAGKTHLSHVFIGQSGAKVVTPELLASQGADQVLEGQKALVVEDLQKYLALGLEEDLLHLYNLAVEDEKKILMTALRAPAQLGVKLKDLSSRLNTATIAEIKAPDDAFLAALIVKQFSDRQLSIDQDVLRYMMARMDRSFAGVRSLIHAVDKLALAEKCAITKPFLRRAFENISE